MPEVLSQAAKQFTHSIIVGPLLAQATPTRALWEEYNCCEWVAHLFSETAHALGVNLQHSYHFISSSNNRSDIPIELKTKGQNRVAYCLIRGTAFLIVGVLRVMFVMQHSIFPSGAGFSCNRLCAFKIWNMLIKTIVLLEAPYVYYSILNMSPNYLHTIANDSAASTKASEWWRETKEKLSCKLTSFEFGQCRPAHTLPIMQILFCKCPK